MRQGLFALLLILSAFGGGALVNGPGLDWARRQLTAINVPDQGGSDPNPEDSLPVVSMPEAAGPPSGPEDAPARPPSAPLPVAGSSPFATGDPPPSRPQAAPSSGEGAAEPVRAPKGPTIAGSPPRAPAPAAEGASPPTPPEREAPEPPPSLLDAARRRLPGREITQISQNSQVSATPPGESAPEERSAPEPAGAPWGDAPDSAAPPHAVLPDSDGGPSRQVPAPVGIDAGITRAGQEVDADAGPIPDGWTSVRRRMEELGVGRFWVEGEFGGPVVFRCVVPVVGDRAVSQHFEAEGDDLISAAEDALRRIALWRATEPSP